MRVGRIRLHRFLLDIKARFVCAPCLLGHHRSQLRTLNCFHLSIMPPGPLAQHEASIHSELHTSNPEKNIVVITYLHRMMICTETLGVISINKLFLLAAVANSPGNQTQSTENCMDIVLIDEVTMTSVPSCGTVIYSSMLMSSSVRFMRDTYDWLHHYMLGMNTDTQTHLIDQMGSPQR